MASTATKAANKRNLEAAGRTGSPLYSGSSGGSSGGSNFVTTKGELIDTTGKVVGQAPAGTTGTFTAGVSPTSAEGSASSTALSRPTRPEDISGAPAPLAEPLTEKKIDPTQPLPAPTETVSERQKALSYLQGLGYGSPDEGEIQGAMKELNLAPKYQAAHHQLTAGRAESPQERGEAMTPVQQALSSSPTAQPSPYSMTFQEDPVFTQLMGGLADFMSPPNQRKSLTETYTELTKSSGIESLNTEMMNMKAIIDGTEEDIRNEVTKTGGFATDSQVLALTSSRNKQLIKNYNTLVDTVNQKQQYINNLMQLEGQDREAADRAFDRKFNISMQMVQYRDKMKENARSQYQYVADKMGFDGLLAQANGDPYYTSMIENSLGLGSGGLQQLAIQSQRERTLKQEETALTLDLKRSQLRTEEAQRDNIYSQIAERTGKDDQKLIQRTYNAVNKADTVITNVDKALNQVGFKTTGFLGGYLQKLPGSDAFNLAKTLTTIKANIGFQELQAMREASPTGGALGQVAVQELEALQATLGSLDIGQSAGQLKTNLEAVKTHYANWLSTVGFELAPDGTIIQIVD